MRNEIADEDIKDKFAEACINSAVRFKRALIGKGVSEDDIDDYVGLYMAAFKAGGEELYSILRGDK